MAGLGLPFIDLFTSLQQAGMKLSLDDYQLLRQSLSQGFGLENWEHQNWEDLRQVCQILWVKPNCHFDQAIFTATFNRYVNQKRREILAQRPAEPTKPQTPPPGQVERRLPLVPPRKLPASEPPPKPPQAPIAVKTGLASLPDVDETGLHLTPTELPVPTRAALDSWRFLRKPLRQGVAQELDLEATVERMCQSGYFSDVVLRPGLSKKTELILLVDDSNVMLPFGPALQPLVQAIESRQISPARLYRFTTYPDDYLYDWRSPSQAIPLAQVLARMHPRRTVVLIWSEAGAMHQQNLSEHRQGVMTFLTRLMPCVRTLIWLNPLPPQRWLGTLAQEIALGLDGRMIGMGATEFLALAKQPAANESMVLRFV